MNVLEKSVYDLVKKIPCLKFFLRNVYQSFFDLLPKPKSFIAGSYSLAENSFFGFHDKCPFSADNSMILSNRTSIPVRMPEQNESLEVGYHDLNSDGQIGEFHHIAYTYSWNYHKGCRLQWLPSGNVIFNTRKGDRLYSVECKTDGSPVKQYDFPIDTVSDSGKMATSFSYERLNVFMPGYGYEYCSDGGNVDLKAPADTGLFIANMESGDRQLLFSLEQLAEMSKADEESDTSYHYVTHSEFSPDGRYVSFLHRWVGKDVRKRYSQLVCFDFKESKTFVLATTGMVSHYVWNSESGIVAYCSVNGIDGHVQFDVPGRKNKMIMPGKLNMDGHQSMIGNNAFVTDTYPDKRRMATLFKVDIAGETVERIAYLYSPKKFQTQDFRNHIACDLHPRMSSDSRFVCIDTVFTGVRSLCVIKLK